MALVAVLDEVRVAEGSELSQVPQKCLQSTESAEDRADMMTLLWYLKS